MKCEVWSVERGAWSVKQMKPVVVGNDATGFVLVRQVNAIKFINDTFSLRNLRQYFKVGAMSWSDHRKIATIERKYSCNVASFSNGYQRGIYEI